jgi:hypothetical protein
VFLLLIAMAGGCGDVSFVPSPYTPQDVDLVYSAQEDITVVRWRISSTVPADPDLRFQILGAAGFDDVDFSQSVFPGGGTLCGDGVGSCFQYVVRGRYGTLKDGRPIQAVHARYGSFSGGIAQAHSVPQTLALVSFFHSGNQNVTVNITDQVASQGPYNYPRGYVQGMWPTNGLCVSDSAPDGVSFSPLDPTTDSFPPDTRATNGQLTDSGIYCVGISPVPGDAGAAALAETRIATRPEVVTLHQTFSPPVVQSPVIYQIVLDLDIPIPDRCASTRQKIEALVDKYMSYTGNGAVAVKKLPTLYLAGDDPNAANGSANCVQTNDAKLDASAMADAVMQEVTSHPEEYQQFHFFFFDNLNAPLLQPMVDSLSAFLSALETAPAPYQLRTLSWLFNPGLGQANPPNPTWTMTPSWQAAEDPSFEQLLASYAMQSLPYRSQWQDPSAPVPLLSADDAMTYDGAQIKICSSAPYVFPVDVTSGSEFFTPSWAVKAADPPGYLVSLPTQQQTPFTSFVQASASVDYQICTRYCDNHPYVSTAGMGESSWTDSTTCAETKD